MPYAHGGELELDPPREEDKLKTTMDPDAAGKLTGDMRALYDRLRDQKEERRAELVRKLDKIMGEEWPDGNIKVSVFGSSGNLLSSSDSDVDICVTTTSTELPSMHGLAALLAKSRSYTSGPRRTNI
jgi:DNA polymerase sigma